MSGVEVLSGTWVMTSSGDGRCEGCGVTFDDPSPSARSDAAKAHAEETGHTTRVTWTCVTMHRADRPDSEPARRAGPVLEPARERQLSLLDVAAG